MFSHRFSRTTGPMLALGGLLWIAASIASVIIGMLTGKLDPGPNAHSPALVHIGIWFLPLGTLSLAVGLLSLYARLQGRSRGLGITAMVFALIGIAFSLVALIGIVSNKYSLNSMGGGFGSFATIIGTGFLGWATLRAHTIPRWLSITLLIMGFVTVPFIFVTPLPVGPAWATDMLAFFLSAIVYILAGVEMLAIDRKTAQHQIRLSITTE